jgi:undecaprenyl pyrophosphate synthase
MFFRKKKSPFTIGDYVRFTEDTVGECMFGTKNVIKRGTEGRITDQNVTTTYYDIKHVRNIEVTYGDKRRILLATKNAPVEVIK